MRTTYIFSTFPREHKLYVKLNKCELFQTHIHYLGNVISKEGVFTDLERVKEIMDWPTPPNVEHVKSFMGLADYYQDSFQISQILGIPSLHCKEKE